MINPQAIIKSQIANDKSFVDLNEILEKYGTQNKWGDKSVTLQFYSKETIDNNGLVIFDDTDIVASVIINTAITITKNNVNNVFISGLIVNNMDDLNLLSHIFIKNGDYENGIPLESEKQFDVHVIKV